jgi:hypothetical protein
MGIWSPNLLSRDGSVMGWERGLSSFLLSIAAAAAALLMDAGGEQ